MNLKDYMDGFSRRLRKNPRGKIEIPNIAEVSRRAALGESWAKLAFENGVSPRLIALRVREYRYANLATDAVLEDIRAERASGKDWLEVATRSGWPIGPDAMYNFASEFNRLMNLKVEAEPEKKRGSSRGRPKKSLKPSAYDDYCTGRKTLREIADDNQMSLPTARKRLLALAGPDVADLKSLVKKEPSLKQAEAEEILEDLIDDVRNTKSDIASVYSILPKGFYDREEILAFEFEDGISREGEAGSGIKATYGLTDRDIDILVALDLYGGGVAAQALERAISEVSGEIDNAIVEATPNVVTLPKRSWPPYPISDIEDAPKPVTVEAALPYFSKPKPKSKAQGRGRKKKVYVFSDEERAYIRDAYYDDGMHVFAIADQLSKQRGEKVTQVAVKEVIADYSVGQGRRSNLDLVALENDARRNLAVSTLAEMHGVSGPTIANALRKMGIQPIYSLAKEARMRKPSAEEIAERQRVAQKVQLEIELILNNAERRQALKEEYLRSNLDTSNDLAVLATRHGLSTYNMAVVLTDIFADEIRRLRNRDRVDELVEEYGRVQLSKIQRDLIDRKTLRLRGNPYAQPVSQRCVIPGAQGAALGILVDQMMLFGFPQLSSNKRNLTSGAVVVGACAADYMHKADEKKVWRAAGGVAGVFISRIIEKRLWKHRY